MQDISKYKQLMKMGVVKVNIFTAFGGVFLGSNGALDFFTTLWIILGTALVVASGCVLNNVLDIKIDKMMTRTANRVLVLGQIAPKNAVIFSMILLLLSSLILYYGTNALTLYLSWIGWFVYIVLYTLWLKRRSFFGIIVGGISGAIPPLIGYVGYTGTVDRPGLILFLILFLWQLPHSWAIVIRRLEEFKKANIKALLNMDHLGSTKALIVGTSLLLIPLTYSLSYYGYTGIVYGYAAIITGVLYFLLCSAGYFVKDIRVWAKYVFIYSVNHLTLLNIFIILDSQL